MLVSLGAAVAALVALVLAAWQVMPFSQVSEERYLAVVSDKLAMLRASKGARGRVVLIGGSGTAFSVSAETLGRRLGRPVLNGGIQASVGLRNLLDLYLSQLDPEHDLVVLLPEFDAIKADERTSPTWCDVVYLRRDMRGLAARPRCAPQILQRSAEELRHLASGTRTDDPVYRRSGFNAVGDLTAHLALDPPAPDLSGYREPELGEAQLAAFEEHVRQTLIARGFAVVYVPAAIPASACARESARLQALIDRLARLSTLATRRHRLADYCLAPQLFFDNAGHLDRDGRKLQTARVLSALAELER
jgi:hypothetical protein